MLLEFLLRRLIRTGRLTVRHADGTIREFGPGPAPAAGMALRSRAAARRLGRNPALALGELYMDGELEPVGCSIYELLELLVTNVWSEETSALDQLLTRSRTLHRRLATEGTSFQKIKDEVRRDILRYYLEQTDIEFAHVSEKLGFSEQSVMTRSCNHWFGASPTRLRARLHAPA